uniref:VWFC domain-containing protein n=1 Tax=Biomphalaria glabrata TaxID=6526 RepID=A0A2C9M6G2_BIOGL
MNAVIVVLALVTLVSVHCQDDIEVSEPRPSCEHKGVVYAPGESVPYDSCNYCACGGPFIYCTLMACPEDYGMCFVEDQWYNNGTVVPSGDSCNTCVCENNEVTCTLMACDDQVIEEPTE